MAAIPKIKRNSEFQSIFRNGRIWSNAIAVLYLQRASAPRPAQSSAPPVPSRIGVCVSKKLGKATARNRVKRLIFEACRLRWNGLKDGCDVILLARRGALEKSFVQVEEAIEDLLRRARLYRGASS